MHPSPLPTCVSLSIYLICPPGSSSLILLDAKPGWNIHFHSALGTIGPDSGEWNQHSWCAAWGSLGNKATHVFRLRGPQPKEDAASSGSLVLPGQPQELSDCSAPACPWLFHLPRPNHNMAVLRGPSPCCTCAPTSSLLSLFPPWREKYTCSSSLPCLIKNLTVAKLFSPYTGREGREGPTMPPLTSPGSILSDVSLCSKEAGY